MQIATQSFVFEAAPGDEVAVRKGLVVVDGHPVVKGHEMYFTELVAEEPPEEPPEAAPPPQVMTSSRRCRRGR